MMTTTVPPSDADPITNMACNEQRRMLTDPQYAATNIQLHLLYSDLDASNVHLQQFDLKTNEIIDMAEGVSLL